MPEAQVSRGLAYSGFVSYTKNQGWPTKEQQNKLNKHQQNKQNRHQLNKHKSL